MPSQAYVYLPPARESEFRLLQLKQTTGRRNEPEIKIFHQLLTDDPQYEAISYCWGGQNPTLPLRCNEGTQIMVTENVMEILKLVQNEESSLILWIDSVCIDQSSDSDKSAQVAIMGEIYKHASQVTIWLGEGSYETDMAMVYLADIAELVQSPGSVSRTNMIKQRKAQFDGEKS